MILLIDNYDSFTYNIANYVQRLGFKVKVCQNDALTVLDIEKLKPSKIILSPGPGNPNQAGITLAVIQKYNIHYPILVICLGHQAIVQSFGGKVILSNNLMHGKPAKIWQTGSKIFHNLPETFHAIRYNSLTVDINSLPAELSITGWSTDHQGYKKEIMAIEHKHLPVYGMQFHPESIGSEHGINIIDNFCKI